jgi:molybdate transport system ATP-binding protein
MFEIAIHKQLNDFALNVELSAPENQLIVLFGPSGAGKSMTLSAISGFVPLDAGRIVVGDQILSDTDRQINLSPQQRKVGLVKQDLVLFPHLTVEQNVGYGLFRESPETRRMRVRDLLERMKLNGLVERYPSQLSGGQQQRVAFARALAPHPQLLLLDEPFSALDAPTRMQLRSELRDWLHEFKIPTLFVTHDLGEAYFLADQLAVLDSGAVQQNGAPGEILRYPKNLRVARAIGVKNILPGVVESCGPDNTVVRVGDVMLDAPPYPFEPGSSVHLCLRPERITLLRRARRGNTSENALDGRLVREMSDGENVTLYFQARSPPGQRARLRSTD